MFAAIVAASLVFGSDTATANQADGPTVAELQAQIEGLQAEVAELQEFRSFVDEHFRIVDANGEGHLVLMVGVPGLDTCFQGHTEALDGAWVQGGLTVVDDGESEVIFEAPVKVGTTGQSLEERMDQIEGDVVMLADELYSTNVDMLTLFGQQIAMQQQLAAVQGWLQMVQAQFADFDAWVKAQLERVLSFVEPSVTISPMKKQ